MTRTSSRRPIHKSIVCVNPKAWTPSKRAAWLQIVHINQFRSLLMNAQISKRWTSFIQNDVVCTSHECRERQSIHCSHAWYLAPAGPCMRDFDEWNLERWSNQHWKSFRCCPARRAPCSTAISGSLARACESALSRTLSLSRVNQSNYSSHPFFSRLFCAWPGCSFCIRH
jgi:hypothetical protein